MRLEKRDVPWGWVENGSEKKKLAYEVLGILGVMGSEQKDRLRKVNTER